MSNTTVAFIFVMTLNVLLFLSQVAMINIAESPTNIYNCEGSLIGTFGNCQNYTVTADPESYLPTAEGTTTETTLFSDILNNIRNWLKNTTGINYLYAMVTAPYNLFKAMLLPNELVFILGTMWYGISLFCIVSFIWGRE